MNQKTYMKKIILSPLFLAGVILFTSCSQNISPEENKRISDSLSSKRTQDSLDRYFKKSLDFIDYKLMTGIRDNDKAYRAYTADSLGLDSASKIERIGDESIKAPSWAK
jgi:hypothetical protein